MVYRITGDAGVDDMMTIKKVADTKGGPNVAGTNKHNRKWMIEFQY
jgi:hypothetical protein